MTITIIRSPKNKSNPYTQIDNRLFDDPRYHPDAVNLISHALRHDDNFKKAIPRLKERFGPSGYRRRKRLAMECGLLKVFTYFVPGNVGGMHKRYRYEIYENPYENEAIFYRQIQCVDSSSTGIDTCMRKLVREKEKKEKKKKQALEPKSIPSLPTGETPEPPSLLLKGKVKIIQKLYDGLVEEYTEPIVTMAIARMNTYMEQSGKYRRYACHGEKLRAWLAKDVEQYRKKLAKQEREKEESIKRKQRDEEIARYQLIQREREQRMAEESARTAKDIEISAREKRSIIEKYMQQYPDCIKQSKMDLVNGVYWFMGECRIIGDDVEMELEKLLAIHNKSQIHNSEKLTEIGIESNNNAEVVCSVKKIQKQSKIGRYVVNQPYPVQKSTTEIGYQAQIDQSRWKNQLNSLLKCYARYPMKL